MQELNLLLEWSHRLHISGRYAEDAYDLFKKLCDSQFLTIHNHEALLVALSYVLYIICAENECLFSISDISKVSGCNRRRFWRLAKKNDNISTLVLKPSLFLLSYLRQLHLSKEEKARIREICKSLTNYISHSPKTILAYAIYIVVRKCTSEKFMFYNSSQKYTIRNICNFVGISPACLYRFKRQNKHLMNS
jgi:transcription initiation factor TFIIIB Brf1 subunit/transcription initiation factor TFIIB